MTTDELRKMREDIEGKKGASNREACIISKSEIARMKASTRIQSVQEKKQQMKIDDEMKQSQFASAAARKAKMLHMDQTRATKIAPTDIEQR